MGARALVRVLLCYGALEIVSVIIIIIMNSSKYSLQEKFQKEVNFYVLLKFKLLGSSLNQYYPSVNNSTTRTNYIKYNTILYVIFIHMILFALISHAA